VKCDFGARVRRQNNALRVRPAEMAPALHTARRAHRGRFGGRRLDVARRRGRPKHRYRSHDILESVFATTTTYVHYVDDTRRRRIIYCRKRHLFLRVYTYISTVSNLCRSFYDIALSHHNRVSNSDTIFKKFCRMINGKIIILCYSVIGRPVFVFLSVVKLVTYSEIAIILKWLFTSNFRCCCKCSIFLII